MSKHRWYGVSALLLALMIAGSSTLFAATPGSRENVSQTDRNSEVPQIAVSGTTLNVVWGERNFDAVFFKSKTIGSSTWGNFKSFEDGTKTAQQWPDVATTPDGVAHVVYATAGGVIYHRSSRNWNERHTVGADNYPNPVRLAAAPDGTLWVVWRNNDGTSINYKRSTNGGVNWGGSSIASQSGNMLAPDVAVGPDNTPHVVWYLRNGGSNGGTARYAVWNGNGWNVSSIGGGSAYVADPVITVGSDNTVHVAYRRQTGGLDWLIQHASRPINGGWSQENVHQTSGDAAYAPGIAVDRQGGVHVTWSELTGSGGRDVWYTTKAAGKSFEAPQNVSENAIGWNSRNTLAVTEGNGTVIAHVIYQHRDRRSDPENDEIFYRSFSTTVGTTPSPTPTPAPSCGSGTVKPVQPTTGLNRKLYLPLMFRQC